MAAGVTTQLALGLVCLSITRTHRLHHRRTGRLTATTSTTFTSHVTLLTNPVTHIACARVVPCSHIGLVSK